MLNYILVGCISLSLVFLATALVLWSKSRKDNREDNDTKKKVKSDSSILVGIDWRLPAAIVICEITLMVALARWAPDLLSALVGNLWFWLAQLALLPIFLFFREDEEKDGKKTGKKKLTTMGKVMLVCLAILVVPMLFNSRTTSSASSTAGKVVASVGHSVSSFFGSSAPDDRKEKTLRDFLDRNKTDNPEVLTRLIRTAEMWPEMIGPRSRVVDVPATGLSEKIPIGKTPMLIRPSEDMILMDDHGREYPVSVINPNWDFPHPTEWVRYRSVSGKPAIVLVSP